MEFDRLRCGLWADEALIRAHPSVLPTRPARQPASCPPVGTSRLYMDSRGNLQQFGIQPDFVAVVVVMC